jgi:hypothetical protein
MYRWSLQLEVLRRIERALEAGDLRNLRMPLTTARRIISPGI